MSSSSPAFSFDHFLSSPSEQLCYVYCNFCDTILADEIPCSPTSLLMDSTTMNTTTTTTTNTLVASVNRGTDDKLRRTPVLNKRNFGEKAENSIRIQPIYQVRETTINVMGVQ
ncbi:hypothetical protein GW17_00052098 [Ensete ventricosum]|nr:hypothetical protein GW17_00052098 [Ensete ventricosum]